MALPAASSALSALVDGDAVDTVLLAAVDVQGRLKGKEYDADVLAQRLGSGLISPEMCGYVFGTDVEMSPAGVGFASWATGFGDVALRPDPTSARILPWLPRTALLLARPVAGDGRALPVAPTTILSDQLDRLAGTGHRVLVGVETEFVLYEGRLRDIAAAGFRGLRAATWDNRDYALDQPAAVAGYTRDLRRVLAAAGMPVEAVKLEGAPGQVEVTFPYGDATAACEQHVLFKHAARAVAEEHGLAPTFMAAPASGIGSGLHLHVSLWADDDSSALCSDPHGTGLTRTGEQAVAGLLAVLPRTGPLWAPYVNSYKRFADHSFAPTRLTWGRDNRTCAVRVVGHGRGLHLEIRLPGADANPYLALAAAVAGIRHGIEEGLKPPPPSGGDAYLDPGAEPLPAGLDESVRRFTDDPLAAGLLGEGQVAHLAEIARLDLAHHRARVTDAELVRGFAQA